MPAPLVLPAPSPPAPTTTQGSTFRCVEARSGWCAFEGRIMRQVLPLFLSFVCFVSSILLALSLPLHRLRDRLFDGQGPEGRLESIQGVLSCIHWPM